jgi:hypothetical protein
VGVVERFEGEFLTLRKRRALHVSMAFTDAGLALGAGTILAPMRRDGTGAEGLDLYGEDRILAALTATFLASVDVALLAKLRHASDLWSRGEKSLAQIYLTQLSLPRIDEPQAFQLFLADRLMASGFSPRELCKQLGFELPAGLKKYSPDQPRVPAGNGRASGRFGSTGGSAGGGPATASGGGHLSYAEEPARDHAFTPPLPLAPAAAVGAAATGDAAVEGTILGSLGADALAGLGAVAAGFAGAVAALGLIFIPSPNGALFAQGAVPGESGLNYKINHDEGMLRIARAGETVVAARLGVGGLYRDAAGRPIARAAGGSIVIDPDALHAAIKAKESDQAGVKTGAEASTDARREEPKLCPAPAPQSIAGRRLFDIQYEQFVRSVVNPQRQPQLPPTLTFGLTNPETGRIVDHDDCRESDGAMIEAKGHYETVRRRQFLSDEIDAKWTEQATRQVRASGGREIEWYFHEQAAADRAQELFENDPDLHRIKIRVMPYPAGFPNRNPRVNLKDRK